MGLSFVNGFWMEWNRVFLCLDGFSPSPSRGVLVGTHTLEESLSIINGRCDLAIATHARKMQKKNINVIVNWSILVAKWPSRNGRL